jgi:hypothetical protein
MGCVFQAGCISNRGRQHFELIWFELNRVTPRATEGHGWGVFRAGCLSNRKRQHFELIWFELNRVTPYATEGHDRGVCSKPAVFQTEGDNTLS